MLNRLSLVGGLTQSLLAAAVAGPSPQSSSTPLTMSQRIALDTANAKFPNFAGNGILIVGLVFFLIFSGALILRYLNDRVAGLPTEPTTAKGPAAAANLAGFVLF